jgi:hypothetical protein
MVRIILCLTISLIISGCFLNAKIGIADAISDGDLNSGVKLQKVFFDITTMNVSEGSSALVSIQMTDKMDTDAVIQLSIVGDTSILQPLPASVTIPAGSLSVPLAIQTVEDSVYKSTLQLQVVLSPKDTSLNAEPNTLNLTITDNDLPSLTFVSSAQSVAESVGVVNVPVQLNAMASNTVTIPLLLSGTATSGVGADYVIASSTLTIAAGQSTAMASITINDDSSYEGSETIILTLGAPTNGSLGGTTVHTITVSDNDLGAFTISGITGASDPAADAFLIGGVLPIVSWSASTGATNYEVTIFANDGTTLVCAAQTTTATNYNFSSCTLSAGVTYKAKVTAKSGSINQDAGNSLFSFLVNSTPIANNDGPIRVMKNAPATSFQVITASDSATRGTVADSDPDAGDSITVTAVTQGSMSGTVTNTTSTVTYTPATGFTGVETFTYTITDTRGATATATVTMHVMDSFTWTGKTSSNWDVNGNWCGSISNNQCTGTIGFPSNASNSNHVAIFDGTCASTGHNCAATINTAVNTYGLNLNVGYSGTLTQATGAGNTLSIGGGGYVQNAGTFTGNNANVTVTNGTMTITNGTAQFGSALLHLNLTQGSTLTALTVADIATMSFQANATFRVSAQGNCGSVIYSLDLSATQSFENVILDGNTTGCGAPSINLAAGETMTIQKSFSHNDGVALNSGTYLNYGNLILTNAIVSVATYEMVGATNATYTATGTGVSGGYLKINKSGGAIVTPAITTTNLSLSGLSILSGGFSFPTGTTELTSIVRTSTLLQVAAGTSLTVPADSFLNLTIPGDCGTPTTTINVDNSITFQNVYFSAFNLGCGSSRIALAAGDTFNVAKTLTLGGGFYLDFDINVQGDIQSTGYQQAAPGRIFINGSVNQNISQAASSNFNTIVINKTSGQVNLTTDVAVSVAGGDFTLLNGILNLNAHALAVSDGSGVDNVLTFGSGTTVNVGGGSYAGESVITTGATIIP